MILGNQLMGHFLGDAQGELAVLREQEAIGENKVLCLTPQRSGLPLVSGQHTILQILVKVGKIRASLLFLLYLNGGKR